jgi:hypothetical protein
MSVPKGNANYNSARAHTPTTIRISSQLQPNSKRQSERWPRYTRGVYNLCAALYFIWNSPASESLNPTPHIRARGAVRRLY